MAALFVLACAGDRALCSLVASTKIRAKHQSTRRQCYGFDDCIDPTIKYCQDAPNIHLP
jgi:hypothetical protein